MKIFISLKRSQFALCIFLTVCVLIHAFPEYNCSGACAGLEESSESDSDSDSDSESFQNISDLNLNDTNRFLRFATPCETPNHEVAYCIEITKCSTLNNVKGKKKYAEFVEASRCGPANEDLQNFKVCCGRYNAFRNVSKAIVSNSPTVADDISVLPKKCGVQRQIFRGRIVGGLEAMLGEYPWMARIIHKNNYGQKSYGCAGFLIHTKYVITAAHCIKSEFSRVRGDPYSVLLGEHNVTSKIDCSPGGKICADPVQISRIDKINVHEKYTNTSKNHHNDIAIIHLRKAVKLSDESSPVKLKVDLIPFDSTKCKEKFEMINLEIDDSQVCAGGEKMKDSCNGDSGGPLMIHNGTHYFAAGLVSYGIGCGMSGWPGVYTSVPSYVDWIRAQIIDVSLKSSLAKKHKRRNKKKNKIQMLGTDQDQELASPSK